MNINKEKIKSVIKQNRLLILITLIFLSTLIYSGLNTFPANDDLPYSFYCRGEQRVTNIIQVVKNQIIDYNWINGRFLVHCMLQFVLIYDRVLFAIINGIVITSTMLIMSLIAKKYVCKDNKKFILILMINMISFLLLFNFKHIIYWAAGSINYIWVYLFVVLVILYYLKTDFKKNYFLNLIIFFLLGNLHECSLVVGVILYISILISEIYCKISKKNRINIEKISYILPLIIGAAILLLAGGNWFRTLNYPEWYSMNLIEKLKISLPELSAAIFDIFNIYNVIPILYIIVTLIYIIKRILRDNKNSLKKVFINSKLYIFFILILLINVILIYILKNKWLYFSLAICLALIENYIHLKDKNYKMIVMSVATYAVVYSMCITPLYLSLRPNYYIYVYFGMLISSYLVNIINDKSVILKNILIVGLIILLIIEGTIYYNLGKVVRTRKREILEGINNNKKIIYLTKLEDKYTRYFYEVNEAGNDDYWCKKYFYKYYNIPEDVDLVVK